MKLDAQESFEKWRDNLSGATEQVKKQVAKVTESPMAKAAAAEDKWYAGLTRAKTTGRFKRGCQGTSLEEWKDKTINVGADRIPAGAAAAEGKQVKFFSKLLPFESKLQAEVSKMGSTTIQDSVARSTKWILGMHEFDKTK